MTEVRAVDEEAIKKAAERAAALEVADRKARSTLKRAEKAEEANFQKEVKPIVQRENANQAKAQVRATIDSFLNKGNSK